MMAVMTGEEYGRFADFRLLIRICAWFCNEVI